MMLTDPTNPMVTHTYEAARSATWSAYNRFCKDPDGDFDDGVQIAALTYWQAKQAGHGEGYARVAARRQVQDQLWRRNTNPHAASLDRPNDKGEPWEENIPLPPEPGEFTWRLTDEEIANLLLSCVRYKSRIRLDRYLRIIHLLRQGWENQSIALDLGVTEDHVATMRKYMKRWLIDYCNTHGIPFDKDWSTGSHSHRAAAVTYYTVRRRRKEARP